MKIFRCKWVALCLTTLLGPLGLVNPPHSKAASVVFNTMITQTVVEGLNTLDTMIIAKARARCDLLGKVTRTWCNKLNKNDMGIAPQRRKAVAGLARALLEMEVVSSSISTSRKGKVLKIDAVIRYDNNQAMKDARKLIQRPQHLERWIRAAEREKELLERVKNIDYTGREYVEELSSIVNSLKALELNDKALRMWPENFDWQQYEKLDELLTQAIGLDPDAFMLYLNRGDIRSVELMVMWAISDFLEALRLNPRCAHAYNMLAMIYSSRYDLDDMACMAAIKGCELGDCGALDFLKSIGKCK